ncbi:MAG TPA: hypothetical protein VGH64_08970 [Puia sp.]|jgi:DNA modification methylase
MDSSPFSNTILHSVINGLTFTIRKKDENVYDVNSTTPRSGNFDKYLNSIYSGTVIKNLETGEWELTEGVGLTPEIVRQIGLMIDNKVWFPKN